MWYGKEEYEPPKKTTYNVLLKCSNCKCDNFHNIKLGTTWQDSKPVCPNCGCQSGFTLQKQDDVRIK